MRELARKDGRYSPEALSFVVESLDYAIRLAGKGEAEGAERHVSGQELLQGMRAYASEVFGPLTPQVWRSWGIRETLDWGRVVFLMVEAEKLSRTESDSLDDFREGFDFEEAFVREYGPRLPPASEWRADEE